ncbi:hypothetical protein H8356DRAFT_1633474 [Neocallimastix lanati (nom. inval.)]|jgi:hypothetical protein|nr:hypothetical protein H8356DRAFT_1633474 [Neocallimastix sp. JGI-2020a]
MAKSFQSLSMLFCLFFCFLLIKGAHSMSKAQCENFLTKHCYIKTVNGNQVTNGGWMINSDIAFSACYNYESCREGWTSVDSEKYYKNIFCEMVILKKIENNFKNDFGYSEDFSTAINKMFLECKDDEVYIKRL